MQLEEGNKIALLGRFLNLSEEELDEITQDSEYMFSYGRNEYKILTDQELEYEINRTVDDYVAETQWEIDNRVDLPDEYTNGYYMSVSVNEDRIREDINDDFPDYVGNGSYEEFEGYYIFEM